MSRRSDGATPEDPEAKQAGEATAGLLSYPAYPDDDRLARIVRLIDTWVGRAEQVVLVALLAIVVLTAASHALLDRFAHIRIESKDQIVRAGTFAIAMLGAAFATHQGRHLSMDLVSRRLSPRARLFLKVILALFTIVIVVLLMRSAFHLIAREKHEEQLLSTRRLAYLIPIGGGQIIFHTILHTIIDIDYIVRRKTPPERMRSAH